MKNITNLISGEALGTLLIVVIAIVGIEVVVLRLWEMDLNVPFTYWGDTFWMLVPIKGMIQNGWTYFIPQLSAPFGLSAAGFPSMTNFDWSLMWLISIFNKNAGAVLNIFWLVSIVFTGLTATIAFHLLGISKWFSISLAIIYAFLPYALYRNVTHISLVYYTIPLILTLSLYFANGCKDPRSKSIQMYGYAAIVIQGLSFIYFSFFSVLILIFSGLLGSTNSKSWRPFTAALFASIVLIGISSFNLLPSFLSWSQYGNPPEMSYKSASEAEIYGLKIRKMLAPSDLNPVPLFREWGSKDKNTNFPNENENTSARLGPMAAVGLIGALLMCLGFKLRREPANVKTIASLTLFCLLFATVGGFAAIFNLVFPDFRAINRFSVFIAFLSLAGIGLWWQSWIQENQNKLLKLGIYIAFIVISVFSLYDQLLGTYDLRSQRALNEKAAAHEKSFIQSFEKEAPAGALVFQLPITNFPLDGGIDKMLPYDHARAYLWSDNTSWSWPSFSMKHRKWQDQIGSLSGVDLVEALVLSKFNFIWIDRFGYKDNGEKVIASFLELNLPEINKGGSDRYVIFDLRNFKEKLKQVLGNAFDHKQAMLLYSPTLIWMKGFYGPEKNPEGKDFRWSRAESYLTVSNNLDQGHESLLSFKVASWSPGELIISHGTFEKRIEVNSVGEEVKIPIYLRPKEVVTIKFTARMNKMVVPKDETRDLFFYIADAKLN